MRLKFWLLVVIVAWFLAQRKPTVIDVYDIDSWTCKSDLFVPQTSSSKFMGGICRRVLVEHQDMVTSVFDCGPDLPEGESVVFLHGFPDNPQTFKKQIEAFAGAGYRVIIPTLRGYEINSQSPKGYHITQLAMDIMCITEAFGIEKFHLVGHDWGAVIAYTLSVYFPSNVKSLTSVAVPPQFSKNDKALQEHPGQLVNSWYMFFFQLPFLPEFLISKGYLIPTLYKHWSPNYEWKDTQHLKEVLETLEMPGVATAAVQYYRENIPYLFSLSVLKLFGPPDPRHPVLGDVVDIPVLLISGESDGCIKTEFYDYPYEYTLHEQRVNATVSRLRGGHFVHYENPQDFNEVVLHFLSQFTNQTENSHQ